MANATQPSERRRNGSATADSSLWQIEIKSRPGMLDRVAQRIAAELAELRISPFASISASRGYLVQGCLSSRAVEDLAREFFSDPVVESFLCGHCGQLPCESSPGMDAIKIHVLPKPGVTDPEAETALRAVRALGHDISAIRTFRAVEFRGVGDQDLNIIARKILANESIEQVIFGPLELTQLQVGSSYEFRRIIVPISNLSPDELVQLSRDWQLSLNQAELTTIQDHFRTLGREPTDVELETIAQTWSEHCSHKTLAGRVRYRDENGELTFHNLLKETIFAATAQIRATLGDNDWCVSVFKDNAGVIRFDESYNITFKVETHNRPSAIEPYGGANTGLGGVIRDTLGTGLGAKPICSTDVFCFAPPETLESELPPGVIHPRRLMRAVVAGVRDYGNRMGIPTVNGAVWFDPRYVGNPMVFCGNIGLIPREKTFKHTQPNDLIVSIGGRTGRDGIHGATFSSIELTEDSERVSSGAVQIGNAITEKMLAEVLLAARDRDLFNAVTDCGAGGFSSAVGEMGAEIGAEVWLERAPLKYEGLSYSEIWISEAQERMVLAVPPEKWTEFEQLCRSESVEATVIGVFAPTGQLTLKYSGETVGQLSMEFLHEGRPPVIRSAIFDRPTIVDPDERELAKLDPLEILKKILACPTVASKHWIIRQYDHEVQAGSVIKPLVGVCNDGPSDAAVVRPVIRSDRAIAIGCGMNPLFGDLDPYWMAAAAIDEALRNVISVGGDPNQTGILDNFCWGYTDRPETLGTLVRAALACRDFAQAFGTPFISGKDSLNNEFTFVDSRGKRQTISIPSTLLISAVAHVSDARKCISMDLKRPGNLLYQVGVTGNHLGGSHAMLVTGDHNRGRVPIVDAERAKLIFSTMNQAIMAGLIRSCHDLSEGGLAVALSEMAFAGGFGADVQLDNVPCNNKANGLDAFGRLFSESNSRFVCEVEPSRRTEFESLFPSELVGQLGVVIEDGRLTIRDGLRTCIQADVNELKQIWQRPLDWS